MAVLDSDRYISLKIKAQYGIHLELCTWGNSDYCLRYSRLLKYSQWKWLLQPGRISAPRGLESNKMWWLCCHGTGLACLGGRCGLSGEADPKSRSSFMWHFRLWTFPCPEKETIWPPEHLKQQGRSWLGQGDTFGDAGDFTYSGTFRFGLAVNSKITVLKAIWFPPGFISSLFGAVCSQGFLQIHWKCRPFHGNAKVCSCLGALSSSAVPSFPVATQSQKDQDHFYICSFRVEAIKKGSK